MYKNEDIFCRLTFGNGKSLLNVWQWLKVVEVEVATVEDGYEKRRILVLQRDSVSM